MELKASTGLVKLTYSVPSEIANQVNDGVKEMIKTHLRDLKKGEILARPENKAEIDDAVATTGLVAAKDDKGADLLAVESK